MDFEKKVTSAIKLLQAIPEDGVVEISYSGGKDSDVILELAKMAGIKYRAVYKMTTIDPPGTVAHAVEMGADIIRPELTFLELIAKKGFPTRRARFCCEVLKEYKVESRAVHGVRRSESPARAKRYHEPEVCRVYSAKEKVRVYYPILDWTDEDVERFISERHIKCAPVYYDQAGRFHVERRLGCLCCPLKGDKGLSDFKANPRWLKAWLNAGRKFFDSHPGSSAAKKFGDAYGAMVHNLFFDNYESYENVFGGGQLFDNQISAKSFLEDYFKIDL